jgi:hypothetical protein
MTNFHTNSPTSYNSTRNTPLTLSGKVLVHWLQWHFTHAGVTTD